jgi:hypothetical protein
MSSVTGGGSNGDFPFSMEAVVSDASLADLLADLAFLLRTPEQIEAHRRVAEACEQLGSEPNTITVLDSRGEKVAVISGRDADEVIDIAVEEFVLQALRRSFDAS